MTITNLDGEPAKPLWQDLAEYIEQVGPVVDPVSLFDDFYRHVEQKNVTVFDMEMAMCALLERGIVEFNENMDIAIMKRVE